MSDADCPSILEFCESDGMCTDIREAAYDVTVSSWSPGIGCGGGTFDGDADLYWQLKLDGVAVAQSSWQQGGCPGIWSSETYCIQPGLFQGPFFLGAWDEDGDEDALQDSLWWNDDGNTVADPIDPLVLLEGVYDGPTGSSGQLVADFTRVDACE